MIVEKWVSLKEISKHLDIKETTVYKWCLRKHKEIPAHKVGRLWKFKISEIDKWVKTKDNNLGK